MRVTTKWDPTATVFIGRPSKFGNPFFLRKEEERDTVIAAFEQWARTQPQLMEDIRALPENAVLGCFCAPKACHGDAIIKLWKEMHK